MIMWNRQLLKTNAKAALSRNYWPAVAVSFIITLLSGGVGAAGSSYSNTAQSGESFQDIFAWENSGINIAVMITIIIALVTAIAIGTLIGAVFQIFLVNVLRVGSERFFVIGGSYENQPKVSLLGYGFKDGKYLNIVKTIFLKDLFQWLWSLLFIIPGIIKGYEYRMIPYLLAENPEMDYKTAFALSKKMMTGEKWNAFVLDLSFIGWMLLSICTCTILAIFYVNPYINMTNAQLYLALRQRLSEEGSLAQYGLNGFVD